MVAALPTTDDKAKRRAVNEQPRPNLSARLQARRDETVRWLGIRIKRLVMNDMLVCGSMKLVRIRPTTRHYFVLYIRGTPHGKVEVRCESGIPSDEKVQRLAALLALLGFTPDNTQPVIGGVRRLPGNLNRLPNLFTVSDDATPEID